MTELWPLTLKDARAHQYATWAKSTGYPYTEGLCTVAVRRGALEFQCSFPIDSRSRGPQCRKHSQAVRDAKRAPSPTTPQRSPLEDAYGQQLQLIDLCRRLCMSRSRVRGVKVASESYIPTFPISTLQGVS